MKHFPMMLAASSPLEASNHRSLMPTSLCFESAASARPSEGSVPRRPLVSEIPRCFDASLNLRPIRHKERWRDYWCNISEFLAGWGPSGHWRKVSRLVWRKKLSRRAITLHLRLALQHLWWWRCVYFILSVMKNAWPFHLFLSAAS